MSDQATTDTPPPRPRRRTAGGTAGGTTRSCGSGSSSPSSPASCSASLGAEIARDTKWLADAFLQLIKIITGPVIFCTVVVGIASLGNLARAGGLALRALGYFLIATIVVPGTGSARGQHRAAGRRVLARAPSAAGPEAGAVQLTAAPGRRPGRLPHRGPAAFSFLAPFVANQMLQVLVLAILTACATSMLAAPLRERIVAPSS